MAIVAARLDERGVFVGMDEVESIADLTPRHLPQIVQCDLKPGAYLWIPDDRRRPDGERQNVYGGAFWELAWLRRIARTRGESRAQRRAKGRAEMQPKPGADFDVLIDYLEERGLGDTPRAA